ncbi:MAG: NRDE family protein [Caldimonas sp.]
MCLVALAIGAHPRFPLVIAANRDEYHARPTEPLAWWSDGSGQPILSGRDLEAGGTWMGLTPNGRLALLTNIRAAGNNDPARPSRGRIVADWLVGRDSADDFWARIEPARHNGFNLIAADMSAGEFCWASNAHPSAAPQRLGVGIHGLSNAALDTPWPKVVALKARLGDALERAASIDDLATALFSALADRTRADDAALPPTGLPIEFERELSSAFVDMPARGYGTRCSTLLITERADGCDRTHLLELGFEADRSKPPRLRRTLLEGWPRPVPDGPDPHRLQPVIDTGFAGVAH